MAIPDVPNRPQPGDVHVHVQQPAVNQPVEMVVPVEPPVVVDEVPPMALTPEQVLHLQRQAQLFLAMRVILAFVEIVLGLRFVLALFGANQGALFFDLVTTLSTPLVFLFDGLFRNPAAGNVVFELTTLFAMIFYALLYWWIVRLVRLLSTAPVVRT